MRQLGRFTLLVVVLLVLSACGGQKEESASVETPGPATAAETAPSAVPSTSIFPPTWTPSPEPPELTPQPTLGPEQPTPTRTPVAVPTQPAVPDYCFEFDVLSEGTIQIQTGESARIAWQPIAPYPNYEVSLWPPSGDAQIREVVQGGSYTFSGELFSAAGVYGWEVWPLDDAGERVCRGLSGEIVVSP